MAQPTPDVPIATYRDALYHLSPWWLRYGIALRIIYVIGLHLDIVAEMFVQGIRRRFPGLDSSDALALSGRDRRIRRGRLEPDEIYAARMRRWLDDHARRGGPYAMLAQLSAHYATAPFAIDLVYCSTLCYRMAIDGTVTRLLLPTFAPDAELATKPGRWWLFYHWPTVPPTDGIWDDPGTWDDGGVWDSGLTAEEVSDLRLIPNEWGNGHSRGSIVLLAPGQIPEDYTTAGPMVRIEI